MKCNQIDYVSNVGEDMQLCGQTASYLITADCENHHQETSYSCTGHIIDTLSNQMCCSSCDKAGIDTFARVQIITALGPRPFRR